MAQQHPDFGATILKGIPISSTPPTDGQILMYDAASDEWLPADSGFKHSKVVLGTNTDTFSIPLTEAGRFYQIAYNVLWNTGAPNVTIIFNSDVATNYDTQATLTTGVTVAAAQSLNRTNWSMGSLSNIYTYMTGVMFIFTEAGPNNTVVANVLRSDRYSVSNQRVISDSLVWRKVEAVTQLTWKSDVALGFKAGSCLDIFKAA